MAAKILSTNTEYSSFARGLGRTAQYADFGRRLRGAEMRYAELKRKVRGSFNRFDRKSHRVGYVCPKGRRALESRVTGWVADFIVSGLQPIAKTETAKRMRAKAEKYHSRVVEEIAGMRVQMRGFRGSTAGGSQFLL